MGIQMRTMSRRPYALAVSSSPCDRDYLDERRFPLVHCPVIVVGDFGQGTQGEIWDTFKCLGAIFSAPQFFDKWEKIYCRRDSWTEYTRHLDGQTAIAILESVRRSRVNSRPSGLRYATWFVGFALPLKLHPWTKILALA